MTREDVLEKVKDVIKQVRQDVHITRDDYNTELTSSHFRFSLVDMAYLYMLLKKLFAVQFEAADLNNYRFNTINHITDILFSKINNS